MRLLNILFLIVNNVFSQTEEFKKHTIGLRFSNTVVKTTDAHPLGKSKTYEYRFEPYYLFSFHPKISVGLLGEYHTAGTTLQGYEVLDDLYGIGLTSRFIYPSFIKNEKYKDRLFFFGELSFSVTNFYLDLDKEFKRPSNKLNNQLLRIRPIGISYDLFKGFNIDLSVMVYKFFPGRWGVLHNIGVSFLF